MKYCAVAMGMVLLLGGCLKEDPRWPPVRSVEATFEPTWNGVPFEKSNVYLSAANERVLVQQVKFYLSGITLIGADGEVLLSAADLFDLVNGPVTREFEVPVGDYDSLRFGLGLPPELNHGDITAIDPAAPLGAAQGMYWTWATLYRFMIFDGRFDTVPDITGTPPFQFSIHTGRDACYRERTVAFPLHVTQRGTGTIVFEVDIARFFGDGGQLLDLSQGSQSHGASEELPIAFRLSDLAVRAINPD